MSVLQHHILTEEYARRFADEFRRVTGGLIQQVTGQNQTLLDRLSNVDREIDNRTANMLSGVLSPSLLKLLGDREAEKAGIEVQLALRPHTPPAAIILPHPALLHRFKEKVAKLCQTLNDEAVRGEAAEIL